MAADSGGHPSTKFRNRLRRRVGYRGAGGSFCPPAVAGQWLGHDGSRHLSECRASAVVRWRQFNALFGQAVPEHCRLVPADAALSPSVIPLFNKSIPCEPKSFLLAAAALSILPRRARPNAQCQPAGGLFQQRRQLEQSAQSMVATNAAPEFYEGETSDVGPQSVLQDQSAPHLDSSLRRRTVFLYGQHVPCDQGKQERRCARQHRAGGGRADAV